MNDSDRISELEAQVEKLTERLDGSLIARFEVKFDYSGSGEIVGGRDPDEQTSDYRDAVFEVNRKLMTELIHLRSKLGKIPRKSQTIQQLEDLANKDSDE